MRVRVHSPRRERKINIEDGISNACYERVAFYTNPRDSGTRDEEEEVIK